MSLLKTTLALAAISLALAACVPLPAPVPPTAQPVASPQAAVQASAATDNTAGMIEPQQISIDTRPAATIMKA